MAKTTDRIAVDSQDYLIVDSPLRAALTGKDSVEMADITLVEGSVAHRLNGSITSNSGTADYSRTDFFSVSGAKYIQTSAEVSHCVFYTGASADSYLGYVDNFGTAKAAIPNGAAYAIVVGAKTTMATVSIYLYVDGYQRVFGNGYMTAPTLLQNVVGITRFPHNLVVPEECVDGEFIAFENGGTVSRSGYFRTGYIPVTAGTSYRSNVGRNYAFYASDKTFLDGGQGTGIQSGITAPPNAAYIRFTVNKSTDGITSPYLLYFAQTAQFSLRTDIEGISWCKGKKINWLGDSIVYGAFDNYVCAELGLVETDYGIGGSTIALAANGADPRNALCARFSSMTNNADIVAVSCGTNDFQYAHCPIGTIYDADDGTSDTTFYGALKHLCRGLLLKYPHKLIFFTTPIKRCQKFQSGNGGDYTADGLFTTPFSRNKYGKTLMDYADIIKEVCGYYSIPVLDMNRESLLNPHIEYSAFGDRGAGSENNRYTHPNEVGQKMMARRIAGWIMQLGSWIEVPVAAAEPMSGTLAPDSPLPETETADTGTGLTAEAKAALLAIAQKVAYTDPNGMTYYQALYDALNEEPEPAVTLSSISASFAQGNHTVYTSDSLSTLKQYLTVTATYSDSSTAAVSGSSYTLSGTLTAGTSTVTVSYGGKTATFTVTVTAVALASISASFSQGNHTVYTTDSLDSLKQYLTVTGTYNNGTTSAVSASNYTLSGTLTAGTSTITVTYSGKTATFNVTVTAPTITLSSISASFAQGDHTFYPSDSLDSLKQYLTVTATYSDSSTATVNANDYTLSGTLTTGTSTITVSYSGKTATFSVTVDVEPTLDHIAVSFTQSTTVYPSDSLDSLKPYLTVTAAYSNSTTQTLTGSDYTLSGTLSAGTSTITVSYGGKTATFTVTVSDVTLSSISASFSQGANTVYTSSSLDSLKQYLTVTATYSDNSTATLSGSNYTLSGTLTAGTSTVTVTYGGKTDTFTVTVTAVALASISASFTQGANTVYTSDSLDTLKQYLTVTATYNDSSTATVSSANYTLSGTLTAGTSTVTVSYSGKTTTFTVTVTAVALASISASFTQGANTVYTTDSLDTLKQYLTVTAVYNDSSTATVASANYTLSGTLTEGTSTITVSYSGKTTTFNVTVTAYSVTLTTISASFTQGANTVYDSATLDSLKQYLTVTATYSDSSTAAVSANDYTLSGSLYVGDAVPITVTYNGQTASFTVAVTAAALPTGYTRLTYIESDFRQSVPTGVYPNDVPHAEYEVMITGTMETATVTGKDNSYRKGNHILSSDGNSMYFPYLKGNSSGWCTEIGGKYMGSESNLSGESKLMSWSLNQRYILSGFANGEVKVDHVVKFHLTRGSDTANNQLYFFSYGSNSSVKFRFCGRLYWAKLYSGAGALAHDYVPCKNSSDVAGLYDRITDTFIHSSSGTELIAGEVVS